MAIEGEEYESDSEEAMLPLAMRRREASDDEEGKGNERGKKPAGRILIGSDVESDGQGGAEAYEEESSEIEEEEEGEEEYEDGVEEEEFDDKGSERGEVAAAAATALEVVVVAESGGGESTHGNDHGEEEVKKVNESFAVSTVGAFYMHVIGFRVIEVVSTCARALSVIFDLMIYD